MFYYGESAQIIDSLFTNPYQEGILENGWKHKSFILDSLSGTYIVFAFPPYRQNYIYSIQITGEDSTINLFSNIRLGDEKTKVLKILGTPSIIDTIKSMSLYFYQYEGRNYSVEFNAENKLYSIKIEGDEGLLEHGGWPSNWRRYFPHSFALIKNKYQEETIVTSAATKIEITGADISFRPRVIYAGAKRKIKTETLKVIHHWIETFYPNDNTLLTIYSYEYKFIENGIEYWIPVQNGVNTELENEVKPGDSVDLFIKWLGAYNNNWVFIANEFVVWFNR
jgi:hypothetical protein